MEYNILIWNIIERLVFEICPVIEYVRKQIKKLREEKGLTQNDLSAHFEKTSQGTISKAEKGPGKLDIQRLAEIAKVLDVDITAFFPKPKPANRFEDGEKNYGYANKEDVDELTFVIKQLRQDIAALKKDIATLKVAKASKK